MPKVTITRKNPDTGKFERISTTCSSCELLRINGIVTHEIGCPEAWRDSLRECQWCGSGFVPTERDHRFCDESCAESYHL